jgi:hypothetical protein
MENGNFKVVTMIADLLSNRADTMPFVHETEALDYAKKNRASDAHNHWLLAEVAAHESIALRELLARWREKR